MHNIDATRQAGANISRRCPASMPPRQTCHVLHAQHRCSKVGRCQHTDMVSNSHTSQSISAGTACIVQLPQGWQAKANTPTQCPTPMRPGQIQPVLHGRRSLSGILSPSPLPLLHLAPWQMTTSAANTHELAEYTKVVTSTRLQQGH